LKSVFKIITFYVLFIPTAILAQHQCNLTAEIDAEKKVVSIVQELTFFNQTNDTLTHIVLNDWMNAYGDKNSELGKRFADEFIRTFHLAKEKDRGKTENITVIDDNKSSLSWVRDTPFCDYIQIRLKEKLLPNQKVTLHLTYQVKIPNGRFTGFGFDEKGKIILKNWFLSPARYERHGFVKYNNNDLDDIANSVCDYKLSLTIPEKSSAYSDLNEVAKTSRNGKNEYLFFDKNRLDFSLIIDSDPSYENFKNQSLQIVTDFKDDRIDDIQRAILIDKIAQYVDANLGTFPHEKIIISKVDYYRNPFYGLNQLPAFISPFPDQFIFEIKFLKTYLNQYLHSTLRLNPRTDNWIYDGIQVYLMMQYIDAFYPNANMTGNFSKLKILRGYNLVSLDFNGQYSYFYMLMARKNLDQPLNFPKDKLIKFNEKIASKYRAGLSLKYLDSYSENESVKKSIPIFFNQNKTKQTTQKDFENLLKSTTPKPIEWFFNTIIDSRNIFDYRFDKVTKTKDSIHFRLKNKTDTNVPIPVFGLKNKNVVFKNWIYPLKKDSIFSFARNSADKIVINYKNEVPEFNLRNNWHSLKGFKINNKPIKFIFFKDLEDPRYNQIIYVPTLEFNLYDGFYPGIRLSNKAILDRPFNFDVTPSYSTRTKNLTGKGSLFYNQFRRDSNLYLIRYSISGHSLHYAPDAFYTKLVPQVVFFVRPSDFRNNKSQRFVLKQTIINRERTSFPIDENTENYSVFSAKYYNGKTEITNHYNVTPDLQLSSQFGKLATEFQYRRLFNDNRQLNIRVFAGTFLYKNTDSNFFDFGLDRPSDYLFESGYLGRSEGSGLFSRQTIITDGFFKSKLDTRFANHWMVTTNASMNIWNWIEVYGDVGMLKNKSSAEEFVYDSGIRLNLVTDYFELYLPVYSSNGWEIGQENYGERIRFIVTLDTDRLLSLFTRKWF
jgi:hypothetical protein